MVFANEDYTAYLTALSIFVAAAGIMYNGRLQRRMNRKQHTISIVLSVHFNEKYTLSFDKIDEYIENPDICIDENKRKHITIILNFYEFTCAALRNGDLDEKLLVDMREGTIIRLFESFEDEINKRRTDTSRPKLVEHIEWFYTRRKIKRPGIWQKFGEFLIGAPLYGRERRRVL